MPFRVQPPKFSAEPLVILGHSDLGTGLFGSFSVEESRRFTVRLPGARGGRSPNGRLQGTTANRSDFIWLFGW